jgi:Domain of unknown function (DUF932)
MTYIGRGFGGLAAGNTSVVGAYGVAEMSDEQIMRVAPSVFATGRHESRSDRYTYIPTSEIVAGMRENGLVPVAAMQGRSRVEGKADFTKHLIRFRPAGEVVTARRIGGLYPEVVVVNSHDGTSAYQVMAGLLRLVCLNGMLVSDRELSSVKVPHKGDVVGRVIEGSFTVVEESRRAIETADHWAGITLNRDEQQVMAEAAHMLRFADADGETTTAIRPEQLLAARRREDQGDTLWHVGNRIQENAIRGGLQAMGRDANNRPRMSTMRPVQSIDGDVKLNRALWRLGEEMARLKAAA